MTFQKKSHNGQGAPNDLLDIQKIVLYFGPYQLQKSAFYSRQLVMQRNIDFKFRWCEWQISSIWDLYSSFAFSFQLMQLARKKYQILNRVLASSHLKVNCRKPKLKNKLTKLNRCHSRIARQLARYIDCHRDRQLNRQIAAQIIIG